MNLSAIGVIFSCNIFYFTQVQLMVIFHSTGRRGEKLCFFACLGVIRYGLTCFYERSHKQCLTGIICKAQKKHLYLGRWTHVPSKTQLKSKKLVWQFHWLANHEDQKYYVFVSSQQPNFAYISYLGAQYIKRDREDSPVKCYKTSWFLQSRTHHWLIYKRD